VDIFGKDSPTMKIKVITVASQDHPRLDDLVRSAHRQGMDITVLKEHWKGFGTKVIATAAYLRTLEGFTHFIFLDAFDTLFLHPVKEVPDHILFSTEKHKWPNPNAPYPPTDKVWAYLNSGSYCAPIKAYLGMIDRNPIEYADDDQEYFTKLYLKGEPIQLDTACETFQSYAFNCPDDFTITPDTIINNITNTEPAIIHFNGKCLEPKIYAMTKYTTLAEAQQVWKDTPDAHKEMHEGFVERVNAVPQLNDHRTFVENHIFGFGERSFPWLWHLVVKEMPAKFMFMEIGVFKGQTLSLVQLLANMQDKKVKRYGVTPLSTEGGVWESDYKRDIEFIHDKFSLPKDYTILEGLSEDPAIIQQAGKLKLDILYIDGGHEEKHITNDIDNYSHLVKPGGFMVIDDCCNSFAQPFGYFQGIESVTKVVDAKLPPRTQNPEWEFIFSVVHNRVYRRNG